MNILVTGATGFIGSHLCKELIQRGYTVFGLVKPSKISDVKLSFDEKKFRLQAGDIRDVNFLYHILKDNNIKAIFHFAAQLPLGGGLNDCFLYSDTNARGTLNLLNAAYLIGVDKFIYASTMSVYSEPPKYLPVDEEHPVQPSTLYSVSKLEGELYCKVFSKAMNIVVLRYGGAYGKGQPKHKAMYRFINQALSNMPITIYGNGTQTTDFLYIKDVVLSTLLAFEKNKPGLYNIGGGEEISLNELAKRIINLTGSKSEIVLVDKETDRPFRFVFDIRKARKDLGYSPHPLNEGLSMYIAEFVAGDSQS